MRLVWSRRATADLIDLRRYIALDNPAAAIRMVQIVVSTVEDRLTAFPRSGRRGRVPGTYELVIPRTPFIVPYRITAQTVTILRVYHAARRWPDQL
jgi:toxin ParE1/3/4